MATQLIPDVPVRVERRGHIWLLHVERCPFCQGEHEHGGGDGRRPAGGYRRAHCTTDIRKEWPEYRLVVPGQGFLSRIRSMVGVGL